MQHTAQATLPNGLAAQHHLHQLSSRFYFERGGTAGNRGGRLMATVVMSLVVDDACYR